MASVQAPEATQTFQTIMAAIGRADRERALLLATDAWKAGDSQPLVLMLAAERLDETGEPDKALELLRRAIGQEQDEPELWRRYGQLLAKLGRLPESVGAFEEALDIEPDNVAVLAAAGEASYKAGSLRPALSYYERADRLRPNQPDVVAAMAAIHAGLQDEHKARELGLRALQQSPQCLTAHIALARADLLGGDPEAVMRRVSPLLHNQTESRVALLDIAADALDALDRPAEAFKAYAARNAILDEVYAPYMAQLAERRVDQARRIGAWLRSPEAENWPEDEEQVASPAAGHAFVLGFPRSGTTLLEKSLAAHAGVATLPEIDLLEKAASEFLQSNDGLLRLANAPSGQLDAYRKQYWNDAAHIVGGELAGKVLVDKLPLHTIALPLISRLFPQARIVFAVRDPRDVVLSCFRRRFRVNSAMYEFLSLERAAAFYDAVMALAANVDAVLPIERAEVRHETLVSSFEQQMRNILDFIGLKWDERVRGFSELAKHNPRTPSDLQLVKGLNTEGFAQWKRYRVELQPIMPLIEPWVRHFGYEAA